MINKTTFFACLVLCLGWGTCSPLKGDLVSSLDFEAGQSVGYTTSTGEFTDGADDYFTWSTGFTSANVYNSPQGIAFFAAQDIDGEGASATQSITWSGIDISGFVDLSIELLAAEDTAGNNDDDWDDPDYFRVFASIDGDSEFQVFGIEGDAATFNGAPRVDTNLDFFGDGEAITDTFKNFGRSFAGAGASLDLRFEFNLDSGDEDLAIDDLRVFGTAVPEPTSFLMFGMTVAGGLGFRRRKTSMTSGSDFFEKRRYR